MSTVPGEISTAEARKIAEQLQAIRDSQTKEEFRVSVLVKLENLLITVKGINDRLDAHDRNLITVNQSIDDSKGVINKILGALILVAGVGGVIAALSKFVDWIRGTP